MRLVSKVQHKHTKTWHDIYELSCALSAEKIPQILTSMKQLGVKIGWCRVSNNEENTDHLFRTFQNCEEAEHFLDRESADWYIDDFGCACIYQNFSFDLTLDFQKDRILWFYRPGELCPVTETLVSDVLNAIEMACDSSPEEIESAVLKRWEQFAWESGDKIENASNDARLLCWYGTKYCFYIPGAKTFYTVEQDGNYYHGYETLVTRIDKIKALDLLCKRAAECRRWNAVKELQQTETTIALVKNLL